MRLGDEVRTLWYMGGGGGVDRIRKVNGRPRVRVEQRHYNTGIQCIGTRKGRDNGP